MEQLNSANVDLSKRVASRTETNSPERGKMRKEPSKSAIGTADGGTGAKPAESEANDNRPEIEVVKRDSI